MTLKKSLAFRLSMEEKNKIDFLAAANNMTTKDYLIKCGTQKLYEVTSKEVIIAQRLVALQFAIDQIDDNKQKKNYRKQVKKLWESIN